MLECGRNFFSLSASVALFFWEKEQALKCVELFLDGPFTISIAPLVQFNGLPGYCVIVSKEVKITFL